MRSHSPSKTRIRLIAKISLKWFPETMSAKSQAKTVTREELFNQVWQTPISTLASDYGVSDVAIAKACKRLNVPRPPRGYWAQIAAGKKIPKPNLPLVVTGAPTSTVIDPSNSIFHPKPDGVRGKRMPIIRVPETLHGCHSLVSATRKCLESCKPSENRLLKSFDDGTLSLAVSRNSMHRALCLMEALIRAVEANGWQFFGQGKRGCMEVRAGEEDVSLEMVEKVERTEIPPEEGETRWWKKYEHAPMGRFTIRLTGYFQEGIRQSWSDGKIQKLESLLPEVLAGISVAAEQRRSRRLESEEQERRWAEEKRIREELAARITLERKRRTRLTEAVNGWHRAEKIRRFCEEVEKRILNESIGENDTSKWLVWARGVASKSDPFENGYLHDAILDKGLDSSLDCDQEVSR